MPSDLRTTVVIDYQNVHLVGHALFDDALPKHETLVDPGLYAKQLLAERNRRQRGGYANAVLRRVLVYRGEPSPEHDPADPPPVRARVCGRGAGHGVQCQPVDERLERSASRL